MNKGVIERIARGKFALGQSNFFVPNIFGQMDEVANIIQTAFPYVDFCIWNSSEINHFTQHQSNTNLTIIEVDKEVAESIFYLLVQDLGGATFLNPSQELVEKYIDNSCHGIVILDLVSEAPTQVVEELTTITIEKLLVDLVANKTLFHQFQGYEMNHIYQNAFDKYTINQSTLLRYASRRGKKEEVTQFLNQIIGNK